MPLPPLPSTPSATIRDRGRDYFDNGYVVELLPTATGYRARVEGTDTYTVTVTMDGKAITRASCTCPYEHGDICKHAVAVAYAIGGVERGGDDPRSGFAKAIQKLGRQLAKQQKATLVELLLELARDDYFLSERLLARFPPEGEKPQSDEVIVDEAITKIRRAAALLLRKDYPPSDEFARHFDAPLKRVEALRAAGKQRAAFLLALALAELSEEYATKVDDHSGELDDACEAAQAQVEAITQEELPEALRRELFETLLARFTQHRREHSDFRLELIYWAGDLATNAEEGKRVRETLAAHPFDGFLHEYAIEVQIRLLSRFESEQRVEAFEQAHLHIPNIRERLLQQAFAKTDYARARKLANGGLQQESNLPRHYFQPASKWKEWLLRIALAEGDKIRILAQARAAILDGDTYGTIDPFDTLKAQIDPADWSGYFQELVKRLSAPAHQMRHGYLLDLLAREGAWDSLLAAFRQNPQVHILDRYVDKFPDTYHPALIEGYARAIEPYLEHNVNAKAYAEAARVFDRIAVLGDRARAQAMAKSWRERYRQRRTLMGVLDRGGW